MPKGVYVHYRRPISDRFWEKVTKGTEPDACWGWSAGRFPAGYGEIASVSRPKRMLGAHRVSWEIHNGPIPEGMDVLHSCDNPLCTNPRHLSIGTAKENMVDMSRKGRQWQQKKVVCKAGHPLSGANLIQRLLPHRACRTCMRRHQRNYKRRTGSAPGK